MASSSDVRAGGAYVEISARYEALKKDLKDALGLLGSFGEKAMTAGAGLFTGGSAALGSLGAATMSFADIADNLDEMSARTGMSVANLSALGYAASLTGASLETVETGAKFIQKAIAGATDGSSEAIEAFHKLGLSVQQLSGMSSDEQFDAVAKALAAIPNQAERTSLAMKVLGRSGTQLIPLIQNLDSLRQEAQKSGVVLGDDAVKAGAALKDQYDSLVASAGALKNAIGASLVKEAAGLIDTIKGLVQGGTQWVLQNQDLVVIFAKLSTGVAVVGAGLVGFGASAFGLSKAFTGLMAGAEWLSKLSTGMGKLASSAGAVFEKATLATKILDMAGGIKSAATGLEAFTSSLNGLKIGAFTSQIVAMTGSWSALSAAIGTATVSLGSFIVAAAPLAALLTLTAGAVAFLAYDLKLLGNIKDAKKDIAETTAQIEKLRKAGQELDKLNGTGKYMTFDKANKDLDSFVKNMIKAGKTDIEIQKELEDQWSATMARRKAATEWLNKNPFKREVVSDEYGYSESDNAAAREEKLGEKNQAEQELLSINKMMVEGLGQYQRYRGAVVKITKQMKDEEIAEQQRQAVEEMSIEAEKTGLLEKELKERRKAVLDFNKWLNEQNEKKANQKSQEFYEELEKKDPLDAVQQAGDDYAAALTDAEKKVVEAQNALQAALDNPKADIRRNSKGEVEYVNDESAANADAAARDAVEAANEKYQLLRNATRAATEAKTRALEEMQRFDKREADLDMRRALRSEQNQFERERRAAEKDPGRKSQLMEKTQNALMEAQALEQQLKEEALAAYETAMKSGKKDDLERARNLSDSANEAGEFTDSIAARLDELRRTVPTYSVSGTFSAFASQGIGLGNSAADRTAVASEETAQNTKEMRRLLGLDAEGY